MEKDPVAIAQFFELFFLLCPFSPLFLKLLQLLRAQAWRGRKSALRLLGCGLARSLFLHAHRYGCLPCPPPVMPTCRWPGPAPLGQTKV